jgi:TPR repeat protein
VSNIQPITAKPDEGWYEAIIPTQADSVKLEEIDRDKFNHAFESFMAGLYDGAYKGFLELSKEGSSISQYYLGLMYISGMGALQDFRHAHMWLNIASSRGHKKARAQLEKLTQKMTTDELAEAQKLARRRLAKINKKLKSPVVD